MTDRTVFVLPGGGLRGAIQAFAMQTLEERLNKKIHEVADMLFCSSAGAVVGASLAAGVPGQAIASTLYDRAPKYFPKLSTAQILWKILVQRKASIYDRNLILEDMKKFGADIALSDTKCLYAACSVNTNTNLPRFFKSDEKGSSQRRLLDVVANSFAAPYYFGMRSDDADKATYSDPGTGVLNNPVMSAFIEVLSRKWNADEDTVTIYVIGTGSTGITLTDYAITKAYGLLRQAKMVYMLGSSQSESVNMRQAEFLDSVFKNINLKVYNPRLEPDEGGFASLDSLDKYKKLGIDLGNSIDITPIQNGLL